MNNTITKIEIIAEQPICFEPSNKATLITGFSGKGKTLMFKLIEYALGENKKIDIEEAKRHFSGLNAVQLTFSNGQVFYRALNKTFDGKIKESLQTDFISKDAKTYKKAVGALFGHEDIKVLKNGKTKLQETTFTVSEYLNTLFFDESRITEEKSFIEEEGYSGITKLKNYYKYFITGKIIDNNVISDAKEEQKEAVIEKKVVSYLGKQVTKPLTEIAKKKKKYEEQLKSYNEKLQHVSDQINDRKKQIECHLINKNKLCALSDLYKNQLSEIETALLLDDFMKESEIKCQSCGQSILWQPIDDMQDEIKNLHGLIGDIQNTLHSIDEQVQSLNDNLESLIKQKDTIKEHITQTNDAILGINAQIEDYLAYEKLKSIIKTKKSSSESAIQQLVETTKEIEDEFSTQIKVMCDSISNRLEKWKVLTKKDVDFDFDKFDFKFNGTIRGHVAKGYRGFCTVAMIIELIKHMQAVGVPCFNFILIDTVWKVALFETENINEVVSAFLQDVAQCGIQIIVFENENLGLPSSEYLHIDLNNQ